MMSSKQTVAVVLTAFVLGSCLAASRQKRDNSVIIDNILYFTDTEELRTRAEALEFCAEEGAELAKVWNRDLYHQIRLAVPAFGSYWINGIDREDENRFQLTNNVCPYGHSYLNYNGIPPENLELSAVVSCLSLVKGSTQRNSKIAAASCNEEQYVICEYPLNGCESFGGGGSAVIVAPGR